MKSLIVILVLSMTGVFANDVIIVKPGKNYSDYSIRDLRKRVWSLEKAVWQLQQKVYELQSTSPTKPSSEKMYTCYLKAFSKTYSASNKSLMAAKVSAIEKCSKDNSSIHCDEESVKCGE